MAGSNTNVTGTATDNQTTPYINGTWVCNLFNPTSFQPTWGGTTNFPTSYGGALDTTGSFSATLPSNTGANAITVGGLTSTQWTFAFFTSDGENGFVSTVTITGASQSITASIVNAGRIFWENSETNPPPCGVGQVAIALGAGTTGCGIAGAAPNSPIPPNQQQGPAYNVRNFGAVGDAKSSRNCSVTGTTTVTSTDNPWVAADVGKKLQMGGLPSSSFGATAGGNANNEVTITVFNSAGSITVSSAANQSTTDKCVWYTKNGASTDDVYMLAAYTAADVGAGKGQEPGYQSPTLVRPGSVFIPKGGYVVCGTIYNDLAAHTGNSTEGVSLRGESGVDIYVAPCFVPPNANPSAGTLISLYLNQRAEIGNISIIGMGQNQNFNANQALVATLSSGKTWFHDININDFSNPFTSVSVFQMTNTAGMNRIDNLNVQGGAGGSSQQIGCHFVNTAVDIFSSFCSNHFINFKVEGSGQRTVLGPHFVLHGYQNDECGTNGLACFQVANSTINCLGCELLNPGGGVGSLSLDTTSIAYLTDSTLLTYNVDSGNSSAIVLAGNAQVYASQSNFSGNNTSAAIAGPSTAKFFDVGGNQWFNQVAGVLTACTAANYTTCAFSGGVVPKASLTHTPNTCYITGTFGATTAAAPMCATYMDQNYQITRIKAASTTSTTCATAPVITISDGAQTATLTLTTAKSIWDSGVDVSTGINSVFATGNTLTVSNTAGTCATPPTNFSVTLTLQSVLNG
jgi:hypothetical protein